MRFEIGRRQAIGDDTGRHIADTDPGIVNTPRVVAFENQATGQAAENFLKPEIEAALLVNDGGNPVQL